MGSNLNKEALGENYVDKLSEKPELLDLFS